MAELTDPDEVTSATTTWMWERSEDGSRNWTMASTTYEYPDTPNNDVKVTEYSPTADDVGHFLRVSVSYRDDENMDLKDPEKTIADPVKTANKVAKSLLNVAPDFVYTADDEIPVGDEVGDVILPPDNADRPTVVREIAENTAADQTIGEPIKAKDDNGDTLTYEFDTAQGTDDYRSFGIDRSTGQISVGASATLDRETKDTYLVRVTAKDPSNESDSIDVTIKLTNVHENPSIVSGPTDITQTEITYDSNDARQPATTTRDGDVDVSSFATVDGDEAGIRIAVYRATDQEDSNPTLLKWSLTGADADRFRICDHSDEPPLLTLTLAIDDQLNCGVEDISSNHGSTSTVELLLMELPDYEDPANSGNTYRVTITVSDLTRPNSLTASKGIVVEVVNVDEEGKVLLSNLRPEDGVPISAVLTDPDGGVRDVTWRWLFSTSPDGVFQPILDATTDTYTPDTVNVNSYLIAEATYRNAATTDNPFTAGFDESVRMATSMAVQDRDVRHSNTDRVSPTFPDQDLNTPGHQADRMTREVTENTPPEGDVVEAVVAEPADAELLTYKLGGVDTGSFTIDRESGQIKVGKGTKLDYETKETYTVTVTATDPSLDSATITVTINVTNVNEAPTVTRNELTVAGDSDISYPELGTNDVATYRAEGLTQRAQC